MLLEGEKNHKENSQSPISQELDLENHKVSMNAPARGSPPFSTALFHPPSLLLLPVAPFPQP